MVRRLSTHFSDLAKSRCRARDLNIKIGRFLPGPLNSITDVAGVKVGHCTLIEGTGKRKPGSGPIRTGVTVITPNDNVYENKVVAGGFILNGAGEMSGMIQVDEWGPVETPIALTNTMSVGRVSAGIAGWMSDRYHDVRTGKQVIIPVVGECDDSFLNDSAGLHVKRGHVLEALNNLSAGLPEEGCVGVGTGMICCDFKAGIGTSSRRFNIGDRPFVLGALVLSNFGEMDDLRIDGHPIGKRLSPLFEDLLKRRHNYGSIIVVLATDLPLSSKQIERVCKRSSLALGRVGSYAAHGSGEIIFGFSTANIVSQEKNFNTLEVVSDHRLNEIYQATVEATEEAIINSLLMAVNMEGVEGNFAPALPLEEIRRMFQS